MAKREMFKIVEVAEKTYKIGRFDALTGSYILTSLLFQILPLGLDKKFAEASSGGLPEGRSLMSKEVFTEIQKECLKVVHEQQEGGDITTAMPVMMNDGRWVSTELSTNIPAVLSLTLHALLFNLIDFFQEGALNDLKTTMSGLDLSQLNVQG